MSIRRNVIALGVQQFANALLPLATLPYLFRVLGPDQFGAYSLAQAVMMQGIIVTDYGFNLSATRKVALTCGHLPEVSRIFWSVQAAKAILAFVSVALVILVGTIVPAFSSIAPILFAGLPAVLGTVLFPQWFFQGIERMFFITICNIGARLAILPLFFILVKSGEDAWVASILSAAGWVLAGIAATGLIFYKRLVVLHRPALTDVADAFRDGWSIFLSSVAISLYTTINPILLGMLSGTVAVGVFSGADRIRQAVQSLLTPLGTAAFPRVSALMASRSPDGWVLLRRLLVYQAGATLICASFLAIFAPEIVHLVMGPDFAAAVQVLRLLSPVLFLVGLSNVLGIQTMLPLGLNNAFGKVIALAALLHVSMLAWMAGTYGAIGAAGSVLLVETLVVAAMTWVLARHGALAMICRGRSAKE